MCPSNQGTWRLMTPPKPLKNALIIVLTYVFLVLLMRQARRAGERARARRRGEAAE